MCVVKIHELYRRSETGQVVEAALVLVSSDGHRNEFEGKIVRSPSSYTKGLVGKGPFRRQCQPGTVFTYAIDCMEDRYEHKSL